MLNIIQSPSPNFSDSSYKKIGIQIHKTLGLMPGTLEWMRNPRSFSSCHKLFLRNGDVHQLVADDKRSWSAGRINQPSPRAKSIMLKNLWGGYVKPGHYMLQWEVECLEDQSYTQEQYKSIVQAMKDVGFPVVPELFWTHKDTAVDKPDLEAERTAILELFNKPVVEPSDLNKEEKKKEIIKLINEL